MTANDVIGKYLIAQVDVPLYAFVGGPQVGVVKKGLVVGPVYSWIQRNGKIYWMFDYSIPGKVPGAYYAEQKSFYWKISTTAAASGSTALPSVTAPSLVPKWVLPVGIGALALFLFK